MPSKKSLSHAQATQLLATLKSRFEKSSHRHKSLTWHPIEKKLEAAPEKRSLGGALFCDRRFDTVFTYHNGAESYYAARAFRSSLRV
jgi:Protein of unknown function (DUF4256)